MPLRKCLGCKDRFEKDSMIILPVGAFHTMDCALDYQSHKREKAKARLAKKDKADKVAAAKKLKKEFYDNDLSTRKKAAKKACHDYIRARDRGKDCICCGRPLGDKYDAGHFIESGNYPFIRYHEDNIHAQSVHCNQYKGGDSGGYEERLIAKIGEDRVNWLKSNKHKLIKRTVEDYRDIENYYKGKIKGL